MSLVEQRGPSLALALPSVEGKHSVQQPVMFSPHRFNSLVRDIARCPLLSDFHGVPGTLLPTVNVEPIEAMWR